MASGLSWQSLRSCRGVIRPLTSGPLWPKRLAWRTRASSTWARKSEEGAPGGHLGELGEGDGGNLDVQVDAVKQRAGDLAEVLLDLGRRARAGAAGIGPVSAGAGVHGGDEDEVGGEGGAVHCPADGDLALLQRLAENLQGLAVELGHLVEESNAFVRPG